MNIIEMIERVYFHLDREKSARFLDSSLIQTINLATVDVFKDRTENEKQIKPYSFESNNQVMMELYTLIKQVGISPVGDTIPYPNDYRFFGELFVTVDGLTDYCRFCPMEMTGTILKDSFKKPKAVKGKTKFYYQELSNSFNILHGGNTLQSCQFKYLSYPVNVSIGTEADKINGYTGGTVQTNTQYIAYDDVTYNGTFYPAGSVFVSTTVTTLTSGIVIPYSIIVNSDMPVEIQDEICKRAADNLLIKISSFEKEQFMDKNIHSD